MASGCPLHRRLLVTCLILASGTLCLANASADDDRCIADDVEGLSDASPHGRGRQSLIQTRSRQSFVESDSNAMRWQTLLEQLRAAFPSSHFDDEAPQDLDGFWDLAHRVWFAEGWEFMPGPVSYRKEARSSLPEGLQDKEAVRAGRKRPGTLNGFFMGQPIQKYPQDMWLFQEILYEQQPDLIVECGTFMGAAANWYGMLMNWIKPSAVVVSIEIEGALSSPKFFQDQNKPNVKYYRFPQGDLDPLAFEMIRYHSRGEKKVMVFLDSDHSHEHVLKQLKAYSSLVSVGQYLIVEDTNIDNNPVCEEGHNVLCGGDFQGPNVALQKWLPTQDNFVEETHWKRIYHMTQNSWLKRVK